MPIADDWASMLDEIAAGAAVVSRKQERRSPELEGRPREF
jgi:hypothetical protein